MKSCKKNFGFVHKSGILMAVSSLPSKYGIGSLGKEAFRFVDFLERTGQSCWQVLPLNPTSYGDSPYQSPAAIAGNPYFIDVELLAEDKLITKDELRAARNAGKRIDYGWLFNTRYPLLRKAYARFEAKNNKEYKSFCRKNADWLEDYALFMALKVHYEYRAWTEWDEEHRDIEQARELAAEFSEEGGFWKWVQFEFMRQWSAVRNYANGKGISIIGDMPIYVAHDSMDVWRDPDQFLLDDDYNPTVVAGCPPDAYAAEGQLWGNPIYNYVLMSKEGYRWWVDRVKKSMVLYDLLRIDHFRGFAGYYSIPFGDETAVNGKWNKGPAEALFKAIRAALPKAKIIAEDLGFITDDVRELLAATDFPGMKVLQFAFYDDNNEYLPRMYATDNCIVYTSTHDSDCAKSWHKNLAGDARKRFRKECPRRKGQSAVDALIELAMKSRANLAVVPLQDYLGLTNEQGRMNVPSVAAGNWSWRVGGGYATEKIEKKIIELTNSGNRA